MDKMNFNVDKNTGKEIIAEELEENEEEDFDLEDTTSNGNKSNTPSNEEGKAKLIKMMLLAIVVIVIGVLLIIFVTSLTGGKKSYEDIEQIMSNAAESYFKDHPESLPKKDGGTQTVDISVLIAEGKMKEMTKYTDTACTGSVKVQKTGTTYSYIPKLDCGEAYTTTALYRVIRDDNKIVTSGYGLYNKDGNYVFRGEQVNNYVQLDSALWRIVKINSANNVVLVRAEPLTTLSSWDDRYSEEASYDAGINNYSSSRIKEKLDELYNSTDESITEVLLSDKDKSRIVVHNVCKGKRATNQAGAEQAVECKEVERDQKISLLTAADFMNASVDTSCKAPMNLTCKNYNYLVDSNDWWLATAVAGSTTDAYQVTPGNGITTKKALNWARIRPVVYLSDEVMYKSGSGTSEDPYIVK